MTAVEVLMPRLSESMEEGTILRWLVGLGDEVGAGDPLVEIETDKSNLTHECDRAGVVTELLVKEGEVVAVGTPIARLGDGDDPVPARKRRKVAPTPEQPVTEAPPQPPGGSTPAAKGEATIAEPTRLQSAAARRIAEARATVPDLCLRMDVDMTACVELRARLADVGEATPALGDFVIKAAAVALREHPRVNAAYRDGKHETYDRVNVGIVVAAGDSVVIPVLHDADGLSLGEIARRSDDVSGRARTGELAPPELSGVTLTFWDLGPLGVDSFDPFVAPPQAAALGVGVVRPRPVVDELGRIVVRQTMAASLACDGRILDPATAAAFLARVRELLENTAGMAL